MTDETQLNWGIATLPTPSVVAAAAGHANLTNDDAAGKLGFILKPIF